VIFCNISITEDVRLALINAGLMAKIFSLTCLQNESIQLCSARCICNITCAVDQHELLLAPIPTTDVEVSFRSPSKQRSLAEFGVLSVIDMICQVRSTSEETKEVYNYTYDWFHLNSSGFDQSFLFSAVC
jgi:hypothetical protein